jgi:hypothetical protein
MTGGRLRGPLLRLIQAVSADQKYFALYRCRVVQQSADLKRVDVVPDDPTVPPLAGIPLRFGVPFVTVTLNLSQPQYVLLGFMGGNPSLPYIAEWEGGEPIGVLRLGGATLDALLDGLVHGRGIDPFTNTSYAALGNASAHILGAK